MCAPFSFVFTSLPAKNTMVRYSSNMVNAEHIALSALTAAAAWLLFVKIVKNRAKS